MMNEWLAEMYRTNGSTPAPEETQKLANAELFAKLATQNGIDLEALAPEQVGELYAQVFPEEFAKAAEEDKKDDEKKEEKKDDKPLPPFMKKDDEKKDEEKKEAAARFWQEKTASQEKFAEADLMGRVMAHSFTQELELIKAAAKAGQPAPAAPSTPAPSTKEAAAQAFEDLAVKHAIGMAKQAGYDEAEAAKKVEAVHVLGLQDSEKVASVQNFEDGVHVRALEYLERAGYPVDWKAVFG